MADALAHADESDQIFTADEQSVEDRHHPLYKAYSEIDLPIVETVGSEYAGEDSGSEEDFRFPWFDCRVRFTLISSLCKLDLKHLPQIQSSLLSALRQEPPYTADVVSSPILRFLFARKKLPKKATRADLTSPQIAALEILFENSELFESHIGICKTVFSSIGLPDSRLDWGQLLAKPNSQN